MGFEQVIVTDDHDDGVDAVLCKNVFDKGAEAVDLIGVRGKDTDARGFPRVVMHIGNPPKI
jgi:hypothetical protein